MVVSLLHARWCCGNVKVNKLLHFKYKPQRCCLTLETGLHSEILVIVAGQTDRKSNLYNCDMIFFFNVMQRGQLRAHHLAYVLEKRN